MVCRFYLSELNSTPEDGCQERLQTVKEVANLINLEYTEQKQTMLETFGKYTHSVGLQHWGGFLDGSDQIYHSFWKTPAISTIV